MCGQSVLLGPRRFRRQTSIERHDYLPFGEEIYSGTGSRTAALKYILITGSSGLTDKFTGKERDAETGLDYFGARYFSGAQGRFTSPDSTAYSKMTNPQSWNLYSYSFNNPLRYTDPDGHEVRATNCGTEKECQATGYRIEIEGDVSSFKSLGQNASRLADLVGMEQILNVQIADKRPLDGAQRDVAGGFSDLKSNPMNVYLRANPSVFDIDDTRGFINGGMGTIPGANFAETMGHELFGHTWGQLFGGNPMGTKGNLRQSLLGEDAVRRTDPSRGLKTTHSGNEVLTQSDIDRLRHK